MSTILRFSKANPVRIIRTAMVGLNYHDPDNLLFHEFSRPNVRSYCQPFEQKDTIHFQFDSSFDTNIIELVRCPTGEVVITDSDIDPVLFEDGVSPEYEDAGSIEFEGSDGSATEVIAIESGYEVLEGRYALTVSPGKYKLIGRGAMNDGSANYEVESEIIEIRERWKNTVLFKYYNNEPNFGIDYRSGVVMQFRLKADFMKPADEAEVENILSATSTFTKINDVTTERRTLELVELMPAWIIQKINLILGHDSVTIDEVDVVGDERLTHNYATFGAAWGNPSVVISLKESDFQNRHDSATRVLFS